MAMKVKFLNRNRVYRFCLALVILTATAVVAYSASVPNTFTSGDTISSSEVNANFDYLAERSWDLTGEYLNYSGNVGIGTTSPANSLEVSRDGSMPTIALNRLGEAAFGSALKFKDDGIGKWGIGVDYAGDGGDNFWIHDYDSGGTRFIIDTDGNVGIGATSPSSKVEIVHTGTFNGDWDNENLAYLKISNGTDRMIFDNNEIYSSHKLFLGFDTDDYLTIRTVDTQGYTDLVRVQNNGDVGIGTTTPAATLDIAGSVKIADDADTTCDATRVGTLRYRETSNNAYLEICFRVDAAVYDWSSIKTTSW